MGIFDGYAGDTKAATAVAPQQAAPSSGGLLGAIYQHLIAPTVNSVGGGLSDIPRIGESVANLTKMGAAGITGNKTALTNANNAQKKVLAGSNFRQNYEDTNLGKALGKSTGQILNIAAPVAGGEELAGKAGIKALALGGAKTGAKLGAVGGAANAMANGESGQQVFSSGVEGAGVGGAVGLGGGVLGATLGKLAGKGGAPTEAIDTAPTGAKPNVADRAATAQAQKAYDQQTLDNFGAHGTDTNGIAPVLQSMKTHGLEPSVEHMNAYGNAGQGIEGVKNYLLQNHGEPVPIDINKVIDGAIKSQPGIGSEAQHVSSGLRSMLNDTLNSSGNLTGKYDPQDVYNASKALYNAKSNSPAMQKAFETARQSLLDSINGPGGLSKAISDYKLPSVDDALESGDKAGDQTVNGHALEMLNYANGNKSLANDLIDKVNRASKFQDLQKAQLPHIRANEIAQSAVDAKNSTLPKIASDHSGMGGLSTAYEGGSLMHGNVAAAPALVAKAVRSNPFQKALGKMGQADESAVGPTVASELSKTNVPQEGLPTVQPTNLVEPPPNHPVPTAAIVQDARTAQPTRINFPSTDNANTQIPIKYNEAKSDAPPIDLRKELPGGALGDHSTPIDLRRTTNESTPVQYRTVQNIPKPNSVSSILRGLTTPGTDAQSQVVRVGVSGDNGSVGIPISSVSGAQINHILSPKVEETLGNLSQNLSGLPGSVIRRFGQPRSQGVKSMIGALTGQAASQAGGAAGTPGQNVPGGLDTSDISQSINQAADDGNNPQSTMDASSIPGGTLQDLQQEIEQDPKNASTYEAIYADAQKEVAASAPTKLNSTEAKNLTNLQTAAAALDTYVSGLNSLSNSSRGVGVGSVASLLGRVGLGGTNGTTAARLDASQEELAIQLAQAMNNGTKPPQTQVNEIKKMLPAVGDPKALADQKIQQLSDNLHAYLDIATQSSTTNRSTGNASTLLSQLTGQ